MKLSDIHGETVFDVIADLVGPIANIASDKEAAEFLTRRPLPAGTTAAEFAASRLKKSLPKLLKDHKRDLITILALLTQTSEEEYIETLTMAKLIKDIVEAWTDPAVQQLFTSAQTDEEGVSSGSAQENTEAAH